VIAQSQRLGQIVFDLMEVNKMRFINVGEEAIIPVAQFMLRKKRSFYGIVKVATQLQDRKSVCPVVHEWDTSKY
jgi:hypothetical protein